MSKRIASLVFVVTLAAAAGCTPTPAGYPVARGGAFAKLHPRVSLERDEHLIGNPWQDTAMLGRILTAPLDPARPLSAQLSPNPCAEALIDLRARSPGEDLRENAERLVPALGSEDTAPPAEALGFFGSRRASHVYYRFALGKRVEKGETRAYTECCQKASCGIGYVRALTFGEGELALAKRTGPGENADAAFDDQPRPSEYMFLERRKVRGYVAFTLEEAEASAPATGPARDPEDEAYEMARLEVRDIPGKPGNFVFCTAARCMAENEFVRQYAAETGSHELDDFDRRRGAELREASIPLWILAAILGAGSGAVLGLAPMQPTRKEQNSANITGGLLLGMGLTALATALPFSLAPRDVGDPINYLTRSQALRFVERYDLALQARLATAAAATRAGQPKSIATSAGKK
jgi:hypothetical protein